MSSFGFLGFVVASINAVVNVANNINDNNNNRNNNNNDNNNNQVNTNIANSMNDQSSMSMAMTGRGIRILDQLKYARDRVWAKIRGEKEIKFREDENIKVDRDDILKKRRQEMEAEVLATMEKMYMEQQEKKSQAKEEEEISEYPREIIDMLGKLYEESRKKAVKKRSIKNSLQKAIEEAKYEEKVAEDSLASCKASDSLIYTMSLIVLAHLQAWAKAVGEDANECIDCIYDEIDKQSEKMGRFANKLSRHLSRGVKHFLGS